MPIYDYRCSSCEATATLVTGIDKELSIPICSHCKAEMRRDYGTPFVSFKGSGFYSTDKK